MATQLLAADGMSQGGGHREEADVMAGPGCGISATLLFVLSNHNITVIAYFGRNTAIAAA